MTLWELGLIVKTEHHDRIKCVNEHDRDARTHCFPIESMCELDTLLTNCNRAVRTEITQIWTSFIPGINGKDPEYYIIVAFK